MIHFTVTPIGDHHVLTAYCDQCEWTGDEKESKVHDAETSHGGGEEFVSVRILSRISDPTDEPDPHFIETLGAEQVADIRSTLGMDP